MSFAVKDLAHSQMECARWQRRSPAASARQSDIAQALMERGTLIGIGAVQLEMLVHRDS